MSIHMKEEEEEKKNEEESFSFPSILMMNMLLSSKFFPSFHTAVLSFLSC